MIVKDLGSTVSFTTGMQEQALMKPILYRLGLIPLSQMISLTQLHKMEFINTIKESEEQVDFIPWIYLKIFRVSKVS